MRSDRKTELAVWTAVIVLAATVAFSFWGFSYDDNFITYRYASNFSDGHGLVFNHGERVFGTSAPGYALLLGALSWSTSPIGLDAPGWGTLLSVLALLTVTVVLSLGLTGTGRWLIPAAFAALALVLKTNVQLMGNECLPVLAAVAGGGYLLFVGGRPALAGLCVAAAMCFRLDAGLAAASIGLVEWLRQKRFPWIYAATGLGVLAGWLLFLLAYFDRMIPMTIVGKKALRPVSYTLQEWRTLNQSLPAWICVLLLVGAVIGLVALVRRGTWAHPLVAAIGLWLVAHEVAYRAVGVWFAPWYFQYLQNAILLLFVTGVWWICGIVPRSRLRPVVLAVVLLPVLIPSLIFVAGSWRRPPDPRFEVYRATGTYIRNHLPPEANVLAIEIGILGYFCDRRILDYGALITPSFAAAKLDGTRARLVARLMPDAIVEVPIRTPLSEAISQPDLRRRYDEVATFSHPDYGGEVRLLVRREVDTGPAFRGGGAPDGSHR